jgi:hypothetical protein
VDRPEADLRHRASAVLGLPGPVAVSRNVSVVALAGAVNEATALPAFAMVTAGVPPTRVQA